MSTYDSDFPGNRNDVNWDNHGMTRVFTPTAEAGEHGSESNWEKKYFITMDELTKEQERSKQYLAEVNSLGKNMLDMQIDASMNRLSDTQISDQSGALIEERDHYYKKWASLFISDLEHLLSCELLLVKIAYFLMLTHDRKEVRQ